MHSTIVNASQEGERFPGRALWLATVLAVMTPMPGRLQQLLIDLLLQRERPGTEAIVQVHHVCVLGILEGLCGQSAAPPHLAGDNNFCPLVR